VSSFLSIVFVLCDLAAVFAVKLYRND